MTAKRYIAKVPSNIALIKYWGKREKQWPANDSLSMTLTSSQTVTIASRLKSSSFEVFVGKHQLFPTDPFAKKIFSHLKFLATNLDFADGLRIETSNTFPASCGIASSASGMGALTLAAIAAWEDQCESPLSLQKLAHLARMGSGSACRSLLGGFVAWNAGDHPSLQSIEQVAKAEHWPLADLIVVTSAKAKSTSSSAGHETANTSPLFAIRTAGIHERMRIAREAIAARDLSTLGPLMETDALDMHAVMMTSKPALNYFTEATVAVLQWIRDQRKAGTLEAYFTVDAGPNPHILCRLEDAQKISALIHEAFPHFEILNDQVGTGPTIDSEVTA